MFGNLINNAQLKRLLEDKQLEIEPFSPDDMSLAHYTLHTGRVKERSADGTWRTIHDFAEDRNPYVVPPGGYVKVVVAEKIKLRSEFLVGQFSPASNLIEQGFGLVAGKIDKSYGTTGEKSGRPGEAIEFGLKNHLEVPNAVASRMRTAHVCFFDLRGVKGDDIVLSDAEVSQRLKRLLYASDAGVLYPND